MEESGLVQQYIYNITIVKVADLFSFWNIYVTKQVSSLPFLQIFTLIAVPLRIKNQTTEIVFYLQFVLPHCIAQITSRFPC